MHDHFADWYRPCTTGTETGLTENLLQKRWTGVAKLAEESAEHALHFVRVVYQKRSVPADVMTAFRAAFKEADPTFQMSGNEFELSVLAGAVACQIIADEGGKADAIALGLICAAAAPEPPVWATPFIGWARSYLDERLRNLRSPVKINLPQFSQKNLKAPLDAFVARLAENNPAVTSEAAKTLNESLLQVLTSTTKVASKAIAVLENQSRLRREETDILWWMTAGVSRDLGVPFKDLKTLAASVVAGKELASLVEPPGVLPAHSLLQSLIPPAAGKNAGKPIGLIAAVNATGREWRQSVVGSLKIDGIADLAPALAAIRQSLTTDEEDGWTAAYKRSLDIKTDVSLQPADLALQIYRECLLAKMG